MEGKDKCDEYEKLFQEVEQKWIELRAAHNEEDHVAAELKALFAKYSDPSEEVDAAITECMNRYRAIRENATRHYEAWYRAAKRMIEVLEKNLHESEAE
jgi:chromosome segregation ATPase